MRFFLDENWSPRVSAALKLHFPNDEFVAALAEPDRYSSVIDHELLPTVARDGFDAFVTYDRKQKSIELEREAIVESGLHWVSVKQQRIPGLVGLMLTTASLLAGMAFVRPQLEAADSQLAFQVQQVPRDETQRVKRITLNHFRSTS